MISEDKRKEADKMQRYKKKLMNEYRYTDHAAELTAWDLCHLISEDARDAAKRWMKEDVYTDVAVQGVSVFRLMEERHMRFPAALIFVDWMRRDPKAARDFLEAIL